MKRIIILAAALGLFTTSAAIAQEEKEQKEYLPKSGEFSIGFDLNPFVNFAGNIFNNTDNQELGEIGGEVLSVVSTTAITQPTVAIVGRYMLEDDMAIRANVGILTNRSKTNTYVVDDAAAALDPLALDKVIDQVKQTTRGGSVSVALEKRLGERRIQGVFSGGLVYGFASSSTKYQYGNAVTDINQTPTSTNDGNTFYDVSSAMPQARLLESAIDASHSFGLLASAGIEYFIAPKVSIGLEVNLIAVYGFTKGKSELYEGYNTFSQTVTEHTELVSPRSTSFTFGTENVGGNLGAHFYF